MGGWAKLALGVLVAALVAVLIVSFTGGDDSTSSSTATVADGKPKGSAEAKAGAAKNADGKSKKSEGGQSDGSASSAAPVEEEAGFTGSGGSEEQSDDSNGSGNKGSNGSGKVGGSGSVSQGSGKAKKKKKKKPKAAAPKADPETAAASAVLEAYMAARATQNWPTACAQMTPKAIKSLERFAAAGKGCVATFTAIYPHLEAGVWANPMSGPIVSLKIEGAGGVALFHSTTGTDYTMAMLKEGGAWKVAAIGPVAV
jgi:hypothetical protein